MGGAVVWFDEAGVWGGAFIWFDEAGVWGGAVGWFEEAGVWGGAVGWFDEAGLSVETQMIDPGSLGFLAPEDTVTNTQEKV